MFVSLVWFFIGGHGIVCNDSFIDTVLLVALLATFVDKHC